MMDEEPQPGELVPMPARDATPVSAEDRVLVLEFVLMALMGRLCARGVFIPEDVLGVIDTVESEALAGIGAAIADGHEPDARSRRVSSAIRQRCGWLRGMIGLENGS
jgi:hypothetical protein